MGAQRKGATRAEDSDELARVPLQAILLADSFATKFRPITLERPKVLLPLVNVPMISYTLAWLESAGVEEVIVFCCAHSKQVISYLESSGWFSQPNFSVTTIESHNSVSAGDALRLIYERNVIQGDFILISGDTVSNMSLTQVLQEHRERKKKDPNAVMTMVIKRSKSSPITRQSRLGTDELFMAIDPNSKQLLYYEDKADYSKGVICLDKLLLTDNSSISLHNDTQDCYIDICSPEVLSLFTDNFDYQHLRRHFVKGLLVDDIMGYKIFTHEIHSSYAARIDNFRSYDTISKDIIQRWTYPFVPDVKFGGNSATKLERQGMYRASVVQSRSAEIGPFTVIGIGTKIGSNTKISNSVVGEGCTIGSNISIEGSYLWNNVTIEDDCKLMHAIVCDGVVMKSGTVLEPGVVLSFKVVIGHQFVVPSYSKVSLHEQPIKQDSDEELEYADTQKSMASRDKKPSKPSSSRTGGIRTLSDLNRPSADSDSDSDGPQEYYTGGEKSGMLVQDPSKANDVDAIFNQARQLGAVEGPVEQLRPSSSSSNFTGTGRLLSGETVQTAPQQPENVVHNIVFWSNGFTVNDGPLRSLDDPENAAFLESIRKSECPKELEPADRRSSVHVNLIRRNENCPEPERRHVPFQGVGRTLGSSSAPAAPEPTVASAPFNSAPTPSTGLVVDETLPSTAIQLRLADGTRMIAHFNHHHTINDIRSFIDASRPGGARNYHLQMMGFPPKLLSDPAQTIEQAGLANSVVIQKF